MITNSVAKLAKARLIEILETASKVMGDKAPSVELQMEYYIETENPREEVRDPCGYPACVLGHVVLQHAFSEEVRTIQDLRRTATDLAGELDSLSVALTGNTALGDSVYEGSSNQRLEAAGQLNFFTDMDLYSFRHLTADAPTGQDAHTYIEALLKHVRAL